MLSIVGVLVVASLAALLFFLLRDSGTPVADPTRTTSASSTSASPSPPASSSASPSPTSPSTTSAPRPTAPSSAAPPPPPSPGGGPTPPTCLGDDPTIQPLAQACFGGDFAACDRLWADTPVGSPYEEYAGTCAGRLPYEEQGTC